MAEDSSFRVKNTLVVNSAFVANSTAVNAAAITSTSLVTGVANATTVNVGANVNITTTQVNVGANVNMTTTQVRVGNATTQVVVSNNSININGTVINNSTYDGTANNASNLGGQLPAFYTSATNLLTGTVPAARLTGTYNITASNATNLNGQPDTFYTNATNLSTGTVPAARLSGSYTITVSNATNLDNQPSSFYTNATNLSTGTVPVGRLTALANTGIVVNAAGFFVNAAYIGTIAANSATGSLTNTFTVGTGSYFVANGNLGVGTATPAGKFNVADGRALFGPNSELYALQVGFNQTRAVAGQTYYIGATDAVSPDMVFSNSGGLERVRMAANGNVGVGIASPGKLLSINGDTGLTYGSSIAWTTPVTGISYITDLAITNFWNGSSDQLRLQPSGDAQGIITFHTGAAAAVRSEAMRIATSGFIGVGTATPAARLDVDGGNGTVARFAGTGSEFQGIALRNNFGNTTQTSTNFIDFRNENNIPTINISATNDTSGGSTFVITTTPTGSRSSDRREERMRIAANGFIGVGTTTPFTRFTLKNDANNERAMFYSENSNTGSSAFSGIIANTAGIQTKLWSTPASGGFGASGTDSNHPFHLFSNSLIRLTVQTDGNITAYSSTIFAGSFQQTSDRRIKENIETIDGALDLVKNLRGVRYTRKDNGQPNVGVIAQEVQEYLPEVVQETANTQLTVNYGVMVSVLIEAVKELSAKVEDLESRLAKQ